MRLSSPVALRASEREDGPSVRAGAPRPARRARHGPWWGRRRRHSRRAPQRPGHKSLPNGRDRRSEGSQGAHPLVPLAFMRGYIRYGSNMIKPVTFTARKYAKIIKLAEHRNEVILKTFSALQQKQTRYGRDCATERNLDPFKIQSFRSSPPSPVPGDPEHSTRVSCLPSQTVAWNILAALAGVTTEQPGCTPPSNLTPPGAPFAWAGSQT